MKVSLERCSIALFVVGLMSIVWSNSIAIICADMFKVTVNVPVVLISMAVGIIDVVMVVFLFFYSRFMYIQRYNVILSLSISIVACFVINQQYHMLAVLLPVFVFVGGFSGMGMMWIIHRVPEAVDGFFVRHSRLGVVFCCIGFVVTLQCVRLTMFMVYPSYAWGSVIPDKEILNKMDLSAYIYAADLNRQGVGDMYDAKYYPNAYPDEIIPLTSIVGLTPFLFSHYEYPPPFLLVPRLAIALTDSFFVIRTVWFALSLSVITIVMVVLAYWVGGEDRNMALLLVPVLMSSLPVMFSLQLGQFHLITFVLSITAMLFFDRDRFVIGGAFLAFAIIAKIFPGVLVVYLVMQKRWRDVMWTILFCILIGLIGLFILGPAVYVSFLVDQVPFIARGDLLAFFEWAPTIRINNQSIYGLVDKLFLLGMSGGWHSITSGVAWIYSFFLVGLTVLAARSSMLRIHQVQMWLALLSLAALRSPLAPGIYVIGSTLWLCTFLVGDFRGRLWWLILCVVFFQVVSIPLPLPFSLQVIVSFVGQLCILSLLGFTIIHTYMKARLPHDSVGLVAS